MEGVGGWNKNILGKTSRRLRCYCASVRPSVTQGHDESRQLAIVAITMRGPSARLCSASDARDRAYVSRGRTHCRPVIDLSLGAASRGDTARAKLGAISRHSAEARRAAPFFSGVTRQSRWYTLAADHMERGRQGRPRVCMSCHVNGWSLLRAQSLGATSATRPA